MLSKICPDGWQSNLALGLISATVAFGGGALEVFPGWVAAGQGLVAGVFLTLAAIQITVINVKYMNEVLPDDSSL